MSAARAARISSVLSLVTLAACFAPKRHAPRIPDGASKATASRPAPALVEGRAKLLRDAEALAPLVTSDLAKRFLRATSSLPPIAPRTVYRDRDDAHARDEGAVYLTEAEATARPEAERAKLHAVKLTEAEYYEPYYGTALAYARALDVLAAEGVGLTPGARLVDFGYGQITQLRLLASLGFDATGIDTAPLYPVMYGFPGDQGEIPPANGAPRGGRVRVLSGYFPSKPDVVAAVGRGYDLVLSKNTLKRGYIHPEQPVDPKHLVQLGVPDDEAIARFFALLKPGGSMLIYNVCPAYTPPGPGYKPWSDGRSPWSRAQLEAAGFVVRAFDKDDVDAARKLYRALAAASPPDDEPWDLEHDISVLYTLVTRPL